MEYAKFSQRCFAFILDVIILGSIVMILSSIFVIPFILSPEFIEIIKNNGNIEEIPISEIYNSGFRVQITLIFVWSIISALFISSNMQATPGKKIMKLQVVSKEGGKVKFTAAFARFAALPLVVLTIQAPERYLIYENFGEIEKKNIKISGNPEIASYLQTPITSITNIITLLLFSAWFLNITRDSQRRAFHDVLFDTRVVYKQ